MEGLALYRHPACLGHEPGAHHAERPARLAAIYAALEREWPDIDWLEAPAAAREQLLRVHESELVALVLDTPVPPGTPAHAIDPDTFLGPGSAAAAVHAAGAGVAAVDAALQGGANRAFCAVRPPGHHATRAIPMGFCLLNNIAVAAAHACQAHGLARVAIIDFDVHHGNGTQDIFRAEPKVMYLSTHQSPLYPDTGDSSERGVGNILNRPLPPGSGSDAFRSAWRDHLLPALAAFRPQLVLVSAGFDGHRRDPLAQMELEAADFAWITRELMAVADRHAGGRLVSMLEGGYDLDALAEACVAHVDALRGSRTADSAIAAT